MVAPRHKRIEVLPQSLVEKIAAGEVIERPGSVVKELVENALDADAGRVTIEIEDAGFALIMVADNGRGMGIEDLRLSVVSHATSKIRTLDDLYTLHTMGFRGEALASIAAVSRLEICSSDSDDGVAHSLLVEGGVIQPPTQAARARGTTVRVRDLFFNTPARRKFMKSRTAERTHINRLVEQIALPFPSVHFVLKLDGEVVLDEPPVNDVRERIGQCAGPRFAESLVECGGDTSGAHVTVFVSPPEHSSSRARFQDLYVNLRRVDCDAVTFAIRNACASMYPNGIRPSFVAFIDIDPSLVDVNIHPTKQRVKFGDERRIASMVYHAVERAVRTALAPVPGGADVRPAAISFSPIAPSPSDANRPKPPTVAVEECPEPIPFRSAVSQSSQVALSFTGSQTSPHLSGESGVTAVERSMDEAWDLITCFQIHGLFIVAPIKNGIMLVDQHAAHERVLFEQALEDLDRGPAASQQLLFPAVVELSVSEKTVLNDNLGFFQRLGYEIDDFGGGAISISAIPASIRPERIEEAVRDMIAFLQNDAEGRQFPDENRRCAAAFACSNAIKAGQELTREEQSALLNSLFATANPYTCPHGRPTVTRISLDELKRRFLR